MSVSGFHVGLLGGVTWIFVRWVLRRGARTAASATLVVLLAYCVVAEPNSPILRATAMGVLACVAVLIDRPMSAVNWLAASALGILLISPAELFDGGFQLSFVQVAALLIVVPSLARPWLRHDALALTDVDDLRSGDADTWPGLIWLTLKRIAIAYVATAVVCWLAAVPLTLFHFAQFTPWGAAQSMLIAPLVTIVSLLGFLSLLLHTISHTLAAPVGAGLEVSTAWLMSATDWLARWPGTYLERPTPPACLVWLMYAPLVLLWLGLVTRTAHEMPLEHKRLRRRAWMLRFAALGAGVVVAAAWVGWERVRGATGGDLVMHVLSVGSGSAAIVVEPGGAAAMFDCGTSLNRDAGETALKAMRELGVRRPLKFVAVSHANSDHFSGLETIVGNDAAQRFVCSALFVDAGNPERGDRRVAEKIERPISWESVRAGDTLQIGGITGEVLWPKAGLLEGWKENDRSLVVRLRVHGRRILLTGDVERQAMLALLAAHDARRIDLRSDVLIAPHHGSVTTATDEFYRAVEPEVVIVSAGDARERLKELVRRELGGQCAVWTTRESGAVTLRVQPDCSLEVVPFRRPPAEAASRNATGRR